MECKKNEAQLLKKELLHIFNKYGIIEGKMYCGEVRINVLNGNVAQIIAPRMWK